MISLLGKQMGPFVFGEDGESKGVRTVFADIYKCVEASFWR